MQEFIGINLNYPRIAQELGVDGRVYISFIVNIDGSISDIKIVRDIGAGCGQEAVRVSHPAFRTNLVLYVYSRWDSCNSELQCEFGDLCLGSGGHSGAARPTRFGLGFAGSHAWPARTADQALNS